MEASTRGELFPQMNDEAHAHRSATAIGAVRISTESSNSRAASCDVTTSGSGSASDPLAGRARDLRGRVYGAVDSHRDQAMQNRSRPSRLK